GIWQTWTWSQTRDEVRDLAIGLDEIGLKRGEAIAIIGGQFETEASGGVNIHTVRNIAKTGVNYISVGALTHSATSLDMSLKVVKKQLA
ncbi:MAG: hypothetical protein KDC44_18830, partial [Phaeodactylibacter sp.]|nr:hypothetical protein [Phaeodactylibacter sp.]